MAYRWKWDVLIPNKRGDQVINIECIRKRSEILGFFMDGDLGLKNNYSVSARWRKLRPIIKRLSEFGWPSIACIMGMFLSCLKGVSHLDLPGVGAPCGLEVVAGFSHWEWGSGCVNYFVLDTPDPGIAFRLLRWLAIEEGNWFQCFERMESWDEREKDELHRSCFPMESVDIHSLKLRARYEIGK